MHWRPFHTTGSVCLIRSQNNMSYIFATLALLSGTYTRLGFPPFLPWSVLFFFSYEGKNVKCTLVQALRLCVCRTTHRGSGGIALPFLDHGTRRGRSLPPGKTRYPLYRRLGGPVWTGAENLATHRDWIHGWSSP